MWPKSYYMLSLKSTFFVCYLFISFCCISQTEEIYSALLVPDELKANANAVVRLNELTVSIESIDELIISQKRIVTVLNEKGNSQVQALSGYDKYNKIKKN